MTESEFQELVTVFEGPVAEATLLRSALGAREIESFIENENIKVTDPFITGANSLEVRLRVPSVRLDAAVAAIGEMRSGSLALAEDEEIPVDAAQAAESKSPPVSARWLIVLLIMLGFPTILVILLIELLS